MRTGNFVETYSRHVSLSDNPVTWIWIAALFVLLLALPMFPGTFVVGLVTRILIAAIGAIGLNLLTGSTGQISLGHAGFLASGSYTTALLIADYGWPPEFALLMSGCVAAALSLFVGVPSLRLKGLYLAITTMAFSFIVIQFLGNAESVTHGAAGVRIKDPYLFGLNLADPIKFYLVCLASTAVVALAALNILRSRAGRAFTAIRDHDIAARMMGINLTTYKLISFATSSFIVGFSGGLMAFQFRFITVDVFPFMLSIEALAMIIVGGLGSVAGGILGAIFIVLLPEAVNQSLSLLPEAATKVLSAYLVEMRGFIVGALIVITLRLEPRGLVGVWRNIKRYWTHWPLST